MPVPGFTIDGVLPPFIGANGPGGHPSEMTPYSVTPSEVVGGLGFTAHRRKILRQWLDHRAALRTIGITRGFQWLDGSFCEDKIPQDLDIVTMYFQPSFVNSANDMLSLRNKNLGLFSRASVKSQYNLDAFFVDLNSNPVTIVNYSRYLLGLFSHRRGDSLWKGMLQVDLDCAVSDAEATAEMDRLDGLEAQTHSEGAEADQAAPSQSLPTGGSI